MKPAASHDGALSRRLFLKIVGAGAAGGVIVACAPAPDTEPAGQTASGASLKVAWGGAPVALDPLSASADVEIAVLNAVYDYLIDTDGSSTLVPRLATGWESSEDGLSYTLYIADGVKWHDGSDLSIDDIIWTFDRLRAPDAGSTTDLYAAIESVEAGEGNSVVFRLSQPSPDFLYALSDNKAVILKKDAADIGNTFIGTGPFRLTEYVAEDRAVFEANPDYHNGRPSIDSLEFVYFADVEAAVNALRSSVVDVVLRMDNPTFLDLSDEDALLATSVSTNGHDLVRLRADRAPGDDERVRLAFKHATDRAAIFDRVQLGFGAVGRDTPIGPLYGAYYTEEFDLPAHDPERARELLAEAGYPDGIEMTLYVPNLPSRVALAQALAAQWAEAGITITIEPQEEAVYYADNGWLEVDLGITPWGSRPVPQIYLDVAYKSGAIWNEAHFSDLELDEQIETAGSSTDPDERVAAYKEVQRILNERGPVIIPYFFAQFGVMLTDVDGFSVHPFAGRTNFNTARRS